MLVFRTGATEKTGFGHVKRSVYLGSLLKNKCETLFCVNNDKVVRRFFDEGRIPYFVLKKNTDIQEQLGNRKEEQKPKGIIFDLREFSPIDLELLAWAKENDVKTIQVTDLGLCQQDVDFTIDASIEKRFPYPSPEGLLSGPDFAILHHKFRHFNMVKRKYRANLRNLFVSLGGGVQYRQLRDMVDMLSRHRFNIKIASGFYLRKSSRKTIKRLYPNVRFVGKTDNLARAFFEADVALITAGMAAAEAAAVGTPALYFYYHDEQKFIAESFQKQGAGLVISNIADVIERPTIDTLKRLDAETRIRMGEKGKKLVDGLGAYRIISLLEKEGVF